MDHKRYGSWLIVLFIVLFAGICFGAEGLLIRNAKFQAFDDDGNVLTGGKLYTYEPGTSTPKATYSDYDLQTANANPVVLDSRGEATIYGTGSYKLVLKDSDDVTIWTEDNVPVKSTAIEDADQDTKIQVEETTDEDIIRFDIAGTEQMIIDDGKLEPTTDNDVDLGSVTKQFRAVFAEMFLGYVNRAQFDYNDADQIDVTAGVYDVNGKIAIIGTTVTTSAISSGGTDWHYLFIDYSAIPASCAIDNSDLYWSSTEPTFSETKKGFYHTSNTDDRCIFAVYTVTDDIAEFYHSGDLVIYTDTITDYALADIDEDWADEVTLTIPVVARMSSVTFLGDSTADNDAAAAYWRTNGATATTGNYILVVDEDANLSLAANTVDVICDSNLKLDIKFDVAGDHRLAVYTNGWYFPIGM